MHVLDVPLGFLLAFTDCQKPHVSIHIEMLEHRHLAQQDKCFIRIDSILALTTELTPLNCPRSLAGSMFWRKLLALNNDNEKEHWFWATGANWILRGTHSYTFWKEFCMLAKTFLTSHLAVISYIFHMLDSWVRRPHLMRRQICLQDCLVSNLHRQLLLMPKFKRNSADKINNRANHCSLESELETYDSTIKFLAQELEHK
jgi:hypothetical protein